MSFQIGKKYFNFLIDRPKPPSLWKHKVYYMEQHVVNHEATFSPEIPQDPPRREGVLGGTYGSPNEYGISIISL
jgi:hypothetical protein